MNKEEKERIEKLCDAIDKCIDYTASQITDDEEYNGIIDLQNDIRSLKQQVCG